MLYTMHASWLNVMAYSLTYTVGMMFFELRHFKSRVRFGRFRRHNSTTKSEIPPPPSFPIQNTSLRAIWAMSVRFLLKQLEFGWDADSKRPPDTYYGGVLRTYSNLFNVKSTAICFFVVTLNWNRQLAVQPIKSFQMPYGLCGSSHLVLIRKITGKSILNRIRTCTHRTN